MTKICRYTAAYISCVAGGSVLKESEMMEAASSKEPLGCEAPLQLYLACPYRQGATAVKETRSRGFVILHPEAYPNLKMPESTETI
jgi:hypothetical protein